MNKLVITLIGTRNEIAGRITIGLDGLPDDLVVLPEAKLVQLEMPAIVMGVQINGLPDID